MPADGSEVAADAEVARTAALEAAMSREVQESINVDAYQILDLARAGHELWFSMIICHCGRS
jgi:hypothetical protein